MRATAARRRAPPLLVLVIVTTLAACQGSNLSSTEADISTREAVLDLGQKVVDAREEDAMLQAQIDSLRGVVAYRDSILRILAGAAGRRCDRSLRPCSDPLCRCRDDRASKRSSRYMGYIGPSLADAPIDTAA